MKSFTFLFITLSLISCGPRRPGKYGANGVNGISAGVDIQDAQSVCTNGGVILSAFKDYNNDGILDINEPVNSVKTVCNGIDGQNASVNLVSLDVGSSQCAAGGVLISSSSSGSVPVCNGVNGLNGVQGIQGQAGLNGQDGDSITPVKFCPNSTANFPEYGIKIGNDIFAVYWDKPKAAFLAKLTEGSYTTTTGTQDCNFTVE